MRVYTNDGVKTDVTGVTGVAIGWACLGEEDSVGEEEDEDDCDERDEEEDLHAGGHGGSRGVTGDMGSRGRGKRESSVVINCNGHL